jgi:hypothetical protein
MDPYLNYHCYRLMQEQLRVREERYQRARKPQGVSAWRRMLDRTRAFFKSRIARRWRVAPFPPLPEVASKEEWLTQIGFSTDQIVLFQRLRQWYAMCNQDQRVMLSHWEFLKRLVTSGKLDP